MRGSLCGGDPIIHLHIIEASFSYSHSNELCIRVSPAKRPMTSAVPEVIDQRPVSRPADCIV